MATRARKSKIAEQATNSLLEALKFVNLIQREEHTHCNLENGYAISTDGVMTAGHPIKDDLHACPLTERLIAALERASEGVAITQLDSSRLSVKSGPLRVTVPCIEPIDSLLLYPDHKIAPIDSRFTDACKTVQAIAIEDSPAIHLASLLCKTHTVAATDGHIAAECWHGIDLPPEWVLPKRSVSILLRIDKKLISFGFSGRSATFWFEDGAWLKTQLYEDKWPNLAKVFDTAANALIPVPTTLYEAIDKLSPFTERVTFNDGKLFCDSAEYDVPELKAGEVFILKQLKILKPIFERYDSTSSDRATFFFGGNARGVISKIRKAQDNPDVL